jgi:hypothetical protein
LSRELGCSALLSWKHTGDSIPLRNLKFRRL